MKNNNKYLKNNNKFLVENLVEIVHKQIIEQKKKKKANKEVTNGQRKRF